MAENGPGPCEAHIEMDPGTFVEHLKETATTIKDKIAKLTADHVLQDANYIRQYIESVIINENQNRQAEAISSGTPYQPLVVGADNGYSLLEGDAKAVVDDYRTNYNVDLLTFDETNVYDAEESLKEHLAWVVDLFDRAGNLPKPQDADPIIAILDGVAGSGAILEITTTDEGVDVDVDSDLGAGSLGSAVEADMGAIQTAVSSWESGTADVFRTQFLPQIPRAAANQVNVLRAMRQLMGMHQGLLFSARATLDGIAHDCLEAVESFEGGSPSEGGSIITTILGVAGGVAAIAGGIAGLAAGGSGAALIGAGISIISGTISVAKTLDGAVEGTQITGDPFDIGADGIDGVLENIQTAVTTTFADLDDGYTKLSNDGMAALQTLMENNPTKMRAPRPGGDPGVLDVDQDNVLEVVG